MRYRLYPPDLRRAILPCLCRVQRSEYPRFNGWYEVSPDCLDYVVALFLLAGYVQDDDGDFWNKSDRRILFAPYSECVHLFSKRPLPGNEDEVYEALAHTT